MKKLIKRIILFLFLLLVGVFFYFDGPKIVKSIWLIKSGEVAQKEFHSVIPFRYENGEIVIKATIGKKEYDFILDTGSPNIISEEIANELGLIKVLSENIEDSGKNSEEMQFVKVSKITMGTIDFVNTGAGTISQEEIKTINRCGKRDGIIGANLMRNAIWQIDYQKEEITITNSRASLKLPAYAKSIAFDTDIVGRPFIEIFLNALKDTDVLIDLGMETSLKVSNDEVLNKLRNSNQIKNATHAYGSSSVGLYGYSKPDRDDYVLIDSLSIGGEVIEQPVIRFIDDDKDSKIGNALLEDYKLIFDWGSKTLTTIKQRESNQTMPKTYGFKPKFQDHRLTIGYVFEKGGAFGLELNDTIMKVNDINTERLSEEQWCETRQLLLSSDTIVLTIKNKQNKKQFTLVNKELFKK